VVGDFTDYRHPWRLLAEHVSDLHIREIGFGSGYLAHTPPPLALTAGVGVSDA
jgi:hypothetical protein